MNQLDQFAAFRQSLAETIAWCSLHTSGAAPESSLRSLELQPSSLDFTNSLAERRACVSAVVAARAKLLATAGASPISPASDLAHGRLLLFDPDGTLSDGAAAVNTDYFFDNHNVPPWDTWVLYLADAATEEQLAAEQARGYWKSAEQSVRRSNGFSDRVLYPLSPPRESYLVCWIPPQMLQLAQNGIEVNPESCIEWLADRDTPFRRVLLEAGLLL